MVVAIISSATDFPVNKLGNEFRMNANSLTRISLKKVLCIKGKLHESFKEDACHQQSSIPEVTVAAGDATARIVQRLLWPEGILLQHNAVLQKGCKASLDTRNRLGSAFAGSIILL